MKHLIRRVALILAILGLSCASAFAQQVKGTVRDEAGEPVIGAAVLIKGTNAGLPRMQTVRSCLQKFRRELYLKYLQSDIRPFWSR